MMVRRNLGESNSSMAPENPRFGFQDCPFYQAGSLNVGDISSFIIYLHCNIAYLGNSEPVCSNKLSRAWVRLKN